MRKVLKSLLIIQVGTQLSSWQMFLSKIVIACQGRLRAGESDHYPVQARLCQGEVRGWNEDSQLPHLAKVTGAYHYQATLSLGGEYSELDKL